MRAVKKLYCPRKQNSSFSFFSFKIQNFGWNARCGFTCRNERFFSHASHSNFYDACLLRRFSNPSGYSNGSEFIFGCTPKKISAMSINFNFGDRDGFYLYELVINLSDKVNIFDANDKITELEFRGNFSLEKDTYNSIQRVRAITFIPY